MSSHSSESSINSHTEAKKPRMNADPSYNADRYFVNSDRENNARPSPVVHIRCLADPVSEDDIRQTFSEFGQISYCLAFPFKKMALVEFENVESATQVIQHSMDNALSVNGKPATLSYSTSQSIKRQNASSGRGGDEEVTPNAVLLLSIFNVKYPITVDVIHAVCSPVGNVLRIVIFRRNGVQSMVEFDSVDAAIKAKAQLAGADIYSNCCTIKAEFAKPTTLTVKHNGGDTWDYTVRTANDPPATPPRSKPLLPDPGFHGMMLGQFNARGGMPAQTTDHSYQPHAYNGVGGGMGLPWQRDNQMGMSRMSAGAGSGYDVLRGGDRRGADMYGDGGRNVGGYDIAEPGCVLMIYGLDAEHMNCYRLFNLLCLYGNVIRIKFLKNKDGSAMAQMRDREACERVISLLSGKRCHGNKLEINMSKQVYIQEIPTPFMLADDTPSYKDFVGNRNNRFSKPDMAGKNRFLGPSKSVYFYNAPPNIEKEALTDVLTESGASEPTKIKILQARSEKSSRGIMQFEDIESAMDAVAFANNAKIEHSSSKAPYVLKLAFTIAPRDDDD